MDFAHGLDILVFDFIGRAPAMLDEEIKAQLPLEQSILRHLAGSGLKNDKKKKH